VGGTRHAPADVSGAVAFVMTEIRTSDPGVSVGREPMAGVTRRSMGDTGLPECVPRARTVRSKSDLPGATNSTTRGRPGAVTSPRASVADNVEASIISPRVARVARLAAGGGWRVAGWRVVGWLGGGDGLRRNEEKHPRREVFGKSCGPARFFCFTLLVLDLVCGETFVISPTLPVRMLRRQHILYVCMSMLR
jgi:hypothetical protein